MNRFAGEHHEFWVQNSSLKECPEGIDNKIFGLDPLNRSPISPKEIKRGRFLQKEVAAN